MSDHSYIINADQLIDLRIALCDLIYRYESYISENDIKGGFYVDRKNALVKLEQQSNFQNLTLVSNPRQ